MKAVAMHDFLGWVTDQNSDMLFSLGRLETKQLQRRLGEVKVDRPIFVTGLARAGTTILLELLAECRGVATYRYMDFPLVMIPYWWGAFLRRNHSHDEAVERSHGDGIEVTPESPEAMEEILWMHFFPCAHDPSASNVMGRDHSAAAFESFYSNTLRKVLLLHGADRYLAKNNYNVARLGYLKRVFPDARFVIPVRDPVWHIASLMKQHRLLSEEERKDERILKYMRRSGHYEFGLDRRPLNLGSLETTRQIQTLWKEGHEVKGWALYWRTLHTVLADQLEQDPDIAAATCIVPYRVLCTHSREMLTRLYDHVGCAPDDDVFAAQCERLHPPSYYAPDFTESERQVIENQTREVFHRLLDRAPVSMVQESYRGG